MIEARKHYHRRATFVLTNTYRAAPRLCPYQGSSLRARPGHTSSSSADKIWALALRVEATAEAIGDGMTKRPHLLHAEK